MAETKSPISVYALGGLCEVGKNTYCIESDRSLIIIDAGVRFPDANLPGVSYVIPNYSKLNHSRQKIKALIITHGHEDHIGAIPFLVQRVYIPVIYAPKLAAALIRHKLEDARVREKVNIVEYDSNTILDIAEFKVSFFYVTHSIPDAYGVCVDTPQGRIIHTGDFKIDLTPVGQQIELNKISRLGSEGVDLLLSDSTNAEIEGYTPSETNVLNSINDIFEGTPGRIILSTFSSNVSRIQQIVEVAVKHGRYIAILGRSMEYVVQVARDLGYIKIPDSRIIPINEVNDYKANEICVLCTGSQGEPMAALSRIANGEHKDLSIMPGDTVVFSSSAIPGNGVLIERVVNQLVRNGCNVTTNSILYSVHSSGHPSKQELRLMLRLVNPKYFMPIHGDYRMLKIHGKIAESLGIPSDHIFVLENGESIVLYNHEIHHGPKYDALPVYIDGKDISGLSEAVIKDREILKDDGLVSIVVGINSKTKTIMSSPKVISYAFTADKQIIDDITQLTTKTITTILENSQSFNELKTYIKDVVSTYVYRKTERKPMVVPVILDEK